MAGALEGVKVLEFSEIIAAPFGGMILADLGADVIKVEPLSGEPWRLAGAFAPGESVWFLSLNRGKRGLAVDLKTAEGQQVIHKLIPTTDVVIINFRPDTPGNLGIDYDTLRALNPRLIYVQNTAFGSKGPQSHRPGYDIVAQAMTGLMATDGKSDESGLPVPMNPPMADYSTGLTIVGAVCAALYSRERSGKGQKIEASLMATALAVQGNTFTSVEAAQKMVSPAVAKIREARDAGASWQEIQELTAEARRALSGGNAYYRPYETADGVVIVACLSAALFGKFSAAVAVEDPRLQPGAPSVFSEEGRSMAYEFVGLCEVAMREKTTQEWLRILDAAGVPAGPFRMVDELRNDEQIVANGLVVDMEHPVGGKLQMFGPLFTMSEHEPAIGRPSPTIGEHNDEILLGAGYSPDDVAALRSKGVIS